MATTIKLKNGSGAPLAGDLVQGEPALDLTNKRLYTEDSGGSVIEVGTNPTSLTTGTFTSTGIDDNATSTAITLDSSGNVGIGTASPGNKLRVQVNDEDGINIDSSDNTFTGFLSFGDVSNNAIAKVAYDHSVDAMWFSTAVTERMRIDSSGNVGIGTDSPSTQLELSGTNSGSTSDSPAATLRLTDTDTSTAANQPIGKIEFYGNDGTVPSQNVMSYILSKAASTNGGGDLRFGVCSSGAASEAMRIDSSGNVGIGTTSPSALLNVASTTGNASVLITAENASDSRLYFGDANSDIVGLLQYDHSNNSMTMSTNATERMRIDSSGNLLVGTTTGSVDSSAKLVVGNGSGESRIFINNGTAFALGLGNQSNKGGYIGAGSTTVAGLNVYSPVAASWAYVNSNSGWQAASDERLKDNIKDISYGLETCLSLRPVSFDWKEDGLSSIGFIAQEVQSIIPEVVSTFESEGNEYLGMAKDQITAVLVKAIQEQQAMIEELKAEVAALKGA